MINKDDNGYILITCLLLLLVLTVIGLAAIGTSTVENMMSGNIRLRETNLSRADSGNTISTSVIERTVREQDYKGFADIIGDSNLANELRMSTFDPDNNSTSPDLFLTIDSNCSTNRTVNVDIDKMYSKWMGGTAIEFASGYEGIGKGGGSGFYTYYRINSKSANIITNAEADVGSIYRYVPK